MRLSLLSMSHGYGCVLRAACLSILILSAAAARARSRARASPRPNIVFIMADDLGWYDVGYHGSDIQTPHIDRLAASGVKLENYYVQPICGPSRTQFLSGRYQTHLGLQHDNLERNRAHGLPLDVTTFAEKLKDSGYSTHLVGKWHQGFFRSEYLPNNRGFDTFYGMLNGNGDHYLHCQNYKGTCYHDLRRNNDVDWAENSTYSGHLFTSEAETVIRDRSRVEQPFFMFLSHQLVHNPNDVPQRYEDLHADIKNSRRRKHAGMTSCLDESLNNITNTLIETGMWNNTILIFSTDNGGRAGDGGYNTPLRGQKKGLFEGGIRGPAFVVSPLLPENRRGNVENSLFHITDWYPTFVRLAGGSVANLDLDGFDMWDTIRDGVRGQRTELLHNIDQLTGPTGRRLFVDEDTFDNRYRAAIRSGRWKLLTGDPGSRKWYSPNERRGVDNSGEPRNKNLWLFDIEKDPQEQNDLSSSRKDVVLRLLNKLAKYNRTAVPPFYPPTDNRVNPALRDGAWGPWLDEDLSSSRPPSPIDEDGMGDFGEEGEEINWDFDGNDDVGRDWIIDDNDEDEGKGMDDEEKVMDDDDHDGDEHSVGEVEEENGRKFKKEDNSVYYHISIFTRLIMGFI